MSAKHDYLERFMRESNLIERELENPSTGKLYKSDISAAEAFLKRPLTKDSLLELHHTLSEGRPILRGAYRVTKVYVGDHFPPAPLFVPIEMEEFFQNLPKMSSFEAHCEFERIHPFEDLNGRTGRLIWLHKYIEERGRYPELGFLHTFYYQTLQNHHKRP